VQLGLTISFLCDRKTTNIPQSQPGFINFIVAPVFAAISVFLPGMTQALENVHRTKQNWEGHTESEKELSVYNKKDVKKLTEYKFDRSEILQIN